MKTLATISTYIGYGIAAFTMAALYNHNMPAVAVSLMAAFACAWCAVCLGEEF